MPETMNPAAMDSCRGTCENDAIASRENRIRLRSEYFVSPA